MRLLSFAAIFQVALIVAPVFATPTATTLEARDTTLTCNAKDTKGKAKTYKVSENHAKDEVTKAVVGGFVPGKSGDPHAYGNGDGIKWGVDKCDDNKAPLFEYPIYSDSKKSWKKETKTKDQDPTPLRVVFANVNGGAKYCGVMTHETVDSAGSGSGKFLHCT